MLIEIVLKLFEVLLDLLIKVFKLEERVPQLFRRLKRVERSLWNDLARQRINDELAAQAVIHGPYTLSPRIVLRPRLVHDDHKATLARQQREKLAGVSPNDPHGLLLGDVRWADDPLSFEIQPADFADLLVLRSVSPVQSPPRVLSANALVVCDELRLIMLHRRSKDSATYPGCLHTVGGGYWPPGFDGREGDGLDLRHTATREVYEETRASIVIDDGTPLVAMEELRTGFIQIAFLGCPISAQNHRRIQDNPEGHVVWLGFDELESRLRSDVDWVPTAKASILAWLAMTAPGAGERPRFNGKSPTELFKALAVN